MASGSNTSQFVRTYGKPRRTQGLGHDSLWHDDLADDFDKCFAIENVQQTTFISPEPACSKSISMHKFTNSPKKLENKSNTISGWSMQLHSTLNSHRANSTVKKRRVECSYNGQIKNKLHVKNKDKKKKFISRKIYSNCSFIANIDSSITCDSKVTPTRVKKTRNLMLPASTPLQSNVGVKQYGIKSSFAKKKKTNLKSSLAYNQSSLCSSEHSINPERTQLCNSDVLVEESKYCQFGQSFLISGSQNINKQLKSELDPAKKEINNIHKKKYKPYFKKLSNSSNNKKCKTSEEHNSNWFNNVMDLLSDKEVASENNVENPNSELVGTCFETKQAIAKPLGCLKEKLSFSPNVDVKSSQSIKYMNQSLAGEEYHVLDLNKSKNYNIQNIMNVKDKTTENPKLNELCDEDESKMFDNSLYESCYEYNENKVTNNCEFLRNNANDINISIINKSSVDRPTKINCNHSQQLNQSVKSPCNNSSSITPNNFRLSSLNGVCNNTNKSYLDSLDAKLLNVLEQKDNLLDVTDKFSNISIANKTDQYDESLCLSFNKSTTKNISKSSSSISQNSSSLDQHTVIYNKNNNDKSLKNNTNSNIFSVNKISKINCIRSPVKFQAIDNESNNLCYQSKNTSTDFDNISSIKYQDYTTTGHQTDIISSMANNTLEDSREVNLFQNISPQKHTISEISSIRSQDEFQAIHNESNSLCDQLKNTSAYFDNISSIKYQEYTTTDHRTDIINSIATDNLEESREVNLYKNISQQRNTTSEIRSFRNQDNFQPIHYESNSLCYQSKNTSADFDNISSIKYEEYTTTGHQTDIINSISNNLLEESEEVNLFQNISRRKRYASRFQNTLNLDSIEESVYENKTEIHNSTQKYPYHSVSIMPSQAVSGFRLEPGKKWRRSIIIVRNFIDNNLDQTNNLTKNTDKGRNWNSTVDDVLKRQSINASIYQNLDQSNSFRDSIRCSSQIYSQKNSTGLENDVATKYIFETCNQQQPISFMSWLEPNIKKTWKKVGEGVYGEVFSYTIRKNNIIVKIIPIEGEININSERQKMMSEVYSEILIATELNKLFDKSGWNYTNTFCKLKKISCVQGKYPKHLINLWEKYNDNKGSDNDNPHILPDTQKFMVLEMENGGVDMESYVFNSASQALYAFLQIVFGLAVAEQQFSFEHRDLHIGNILVKKISSKKQVSFKLDGDVFNIPSHGCKITIIDFTLSRMNCFNKTVYNNLANDAELFTSDGDYQFEIYRLMKQETKNQWSSFKPKTNIYWLHYVLDKMCKTVHYKKTSTNVHRIGLSNLSKMYDSILLFDSAKSLAESEMILNFLDNY